MDRCHTNGESDTLRDVPRPATGKTFVARARVPSPRWAAFEKNADLLGSDRSKLINEFIALIERDPELWRDVRAIADQREELLDAVVLAALRRYRSRHRDLLATPVAEARRVLLDEAERENQGNPDE